MTLFSPSKATSYHFQYCTNDVDLLAGCHTRMLIFKMPRCRASLDCPAFLIDYDKEACFKLDTNSEDNRQVFLNRFVIGSLTSSADLPQEEGDILWAKTSSLDYRREPIISAFFIFVK